MSITVDVLSSEGKGKLGEGCGESLMRVGVGGECVVTATQT